MPTDTSEKGLETILVNYLRDKQGYIQSASEDYNVDYALICSQVESFLVQTQPQKVAESLAFASDYNRRNFFERLKNEITSRGVIDVIRKGYRFNTTLFDMYCPIPSELNDTAKETYKKNIFCVVRQLHFSKDKPLDSIDVAIFLNGMPVITFELKNLITGQSVANAIAQYGKDRNPRDLLFMPKRCAVHFAVDDDQVMMCTMLKGKDSWFLPFNKGVDGGAGNPVNPNGLKTAYLWEEILSKESLSDILENYAQVVKIKDKKTGRVKEEKCIFPRYHQLDAVRYFIKQTKDLPVGQRFLIQHSAGSGKSNTITWLSYQLVGLKNGTESVVDSVIVVTDRVNLDNQIKDNIMLYNQLGNIVGWADSSDQLRKELQSGKKIIITIVHKFQYILEAIGGSLSNKKFAIIIDEAHSSQNGSLSAKMNAALSGVVANEEELEDKLNSIIESRRMVKNANYYAFTATPKNKTLEMFGKPVQNPDGSVGHIPHHVYTMRQAIQEGFIRDVLEHYTPYQSYYKIVRKSEESDPEFDRKQAEGKLRWWVESRPETVEKKAAIMVKHFLEQVIGKGKVGGQARAMVVTAGIERAIDYYYAITKQLEANNSQYKAIVAFSGEKEYAGRVVTESSINGFSSSDIEENMGKDPYRILVVADKFQTGYDQPLLHTMYVDKTISDIKAVQTLSRLNRCHPKKKDTFVLDFANNPDDIQAAFQKYYKTTSLTHETDINKLNDLLQDVDALNFYTRAEVRKLNELYFGNASREAIDPILDECTERFKALTEDDQIQGKGNMKTFVRTYSFLAAIMTVGSTEWEMLYTFYKLLIPKLPKLKFEDWTEGLLEAINFDQLRVDEKEERKLTLENSNSEIEPIPTGTAHGGTKDPDLVPLSNILEEFNQIYGGIDWSYPAEVSKEITELPAQLANVESFKNAVLHSDSANAQIEGNTALADIIIRNMAAQSELSRFFLQNEQFRMFITNRVINEAMSIAQNQ